MDLLKTKFYVCNLLFENRIMYVIVNILFNKDKIIQLDNKLCTYSINILFNKDKIVQLDNKKQMLFFNIPNPIFFLNNKMLL